MLRSTTVLAVACLVTGCSLPSSPPPPATPTTADRLPLAAEDTGAHYSRPEWGDWATLANGCSTREDVLVKQGAGVRTGTGCKVLSGSWSSPYDSQVLTEATLVQIDHVVPVHEAVQSGRLVGGQRVGPRDWDKATRIRFYNDEDNLLAVPGRLNEQKGDQDPAQWLPPAGRCGYVHAWVAIKQKYDLSADQAELDAIGRVLAGCKGRTETWR
jgi:hypothetical protein